MCELIVDEFLTLDGVAQAPGGEDEDRSGDFPHGGWHMPYMDDDAARAWVVAGITEAGGFVLGRRTYEIFAAYWPNAPAEEAVSAIIAKPLNDKAKYVASTTLDEPLAWQSSRLLRGDVEEAVRDLKREEGGELHVIGSTRLVRGLLAADLVDELRLMIDPLVVGGGKRIFDDGGVLRRFRLLRHEATGTGAILAAFRRQER
ncbi:MAG TPA: dihydrofolate reductase family protein [Thermoleophilia bacterium]|nr:dihydrofolate reductase family protein [Thermoleophilia bacterium]